MLTVSVVIPVYRAEQTLFDLYQQLSAAMSKITSVFEIIFVEDGGGDGSWPIIARLARTDHRVRGIRMSRNYGQHNALLCGIRAAKHGIILTMDDDLQHPVSEIAPILAALKPEYDVVYGAPQEEQHGFPARSRFALDKNSACQHHGRRDRPQRERLPRFPYTPARRLPGISQPFCVDRRAADLDHHAFYRHQGSPCTALQRRIGLHSRQTHPPRGQPDDGLQYAAAPDRQRGWLCLCLVRLLCSGVMYWPTT